MNAGSRASAVPRRGVVAHPVTVYYDASCALCRSEMHTLVARASPGAFDLVDCSAPGFRDDACTNAGITRDALLSRIHARDATGRWLRGLDVFAAVYRAAGFVLVARVCESRALRPGLDRAYAWVADHRQTLSRSGLAHAFGLLARIAPLATTGRACRDGACAPPAHRGDCR